MANGCDESVAAWTPESSCVLRSKHSRPWARKRSRSAERELAATGERARKRGVETGSELTSQEAQIAQMAREGLSNAEIGERLFISRHTVAYHLRKVFTKLSISSRNQLARVLPAEPPLGAQP
jgi:DNA-binding CsgD family transcriptional regulator